ncbi:hypothetical protein [Bradyrhizobium sp.]|uniref:hypothetical protein n=1 Tax=Bradyrhizobium sp. TaxID=376 RepID=UPI0039E2D904
MGTHAGLAHPAEDKVGRGAKLLAEIDAGELIGFFGDRTKLVDPADDLFAERCILNGVVGTHLGELSILWDHGSWQPRDRRYKFSASKIARPARRSQRCR